MAWFEQDAIDFFRELELNNNREWFEKNKKRYEANVKKPMEAFADHMIGRMREILPNIQTTGKQAVFRAVKKLRRALEPLTSRRAPASSHEVVL